MQYDLPWELKELQTAIRRFVDTELTPLERQVPEGDDIPDDLRARLEQKVKASGYWGLEVPEEFGGLGLNYMGLAVVWEQVGRSMLVPFRAPWLFGRSPGPVLLDHSTPQQRERYLMPLLAGQTRTAFAITEPNAGSDAGALQTTAVRDGDDWVLNGTKIFVSGGLKADFFQVFAVAQPSNHDQGGITCFLVDRGTPGFTIGSTFELMVGETPVELILDNCRVPDSNRVGSVGKGFTLAKAWFTRGRLRHGPMAVGMAQRALEIATEFARQRVTFGRPLADRQAIQTMLADSAVDIHAARLMSYHCAEKMDRGEDATHEAAMVKLFADEMAFRVVDRAVQILGGMGLSKELPLERMFRDSRTRRITEGASEILRTMIARDLIKHL